MRLLLGDSLELLPKLDACSVDAIITDPPQPVQDVEFSAPVLQQFMRITSGPIVWISGEANRYPDVSHYLPAPDAFLCWQPSRCWTYRGEPLSSARPLQAEFHPILIWQLNCTIPFPLRYDMDVEPGWWVNKYSKPVALIQELLYLLTEPYQTVLDPFMGRGACALACDLEDRNFYGIDIDPEAIDITRRRLDEHDA